MDGEILETLWAVLNEVGCTTQMMPLAHRLEVLDARMLNNNWKKKINIGISLGYCGSGGCEENGMGHTLRGF